MGTGCPIIYFPKQNDIAKKAIEKRRQSPEEKRKMALRTIISLLRRQIATNRSMKVDLNRHSVGTTTLYGLTSVTTDRIPSLDLETSKKIMMDQCATSVIISWPVSKYGGNTEEIFPREVSKMEEYLRQSCNHEVTTSRPFFVLDGGGQRMASLSLIGH